MIMGYTGIGNCEYKEALCRSRLPRGSGLRVTRRDDDLNNEQVPGLCSQGGGGGPSAVLLLPSYLNDTTQEVRDNDY